MAYKGSNPNLNTARLVDQTTGTPGNPPSGSHAIINRNGVLYLRDSSGGETIVGTSGTGVNYILNPDAEGGTDGWNRYDDTDTATTTPTDGTGTDTALNLTFARNTTTPLRGNADFKLTKDAADRQGEGVSYDITIDKADYSKQMVISFDFDASHSSYAAGDLAVYLVKDTGGTPTVVTPATTDIPAGTGTFKTTFVGTTDDDWRLCIHVASTNTSGYDVYFDNFKVGPEENVEGVPVTEWASYTASSIAGFGTTTSENLEWRRVGDTMEIRGYFTTGTSAASEAQIALPNDLTIGGNYADTIQVGTFWRDTASTSHGILIATKGDTYLNCGDWRNDSTSINPLAPANGSAVAGNSNRVAIFATGIPIAEWAGSTASLANTRVEYAYNSTAWGDSSDSSAFAYGPNGVAFAATDLTSRRTRRVRFQSPIQETDRIVVEFYTNGHWVPAVGAYLSTTYACEQYRYGGAVGAANSVGVGWQPVSGSETDVDVVFGRYFNTYNGDASAIGWSTGVSTSERWRVVKCSNPLSVGALDETTGSGSLASATINWNGTDPTTINTSNYEWVKDGDWVDLWMFIEYSVAGSSNSSCDITFPSGVPKPDDPGVGNSAWWYAGSGFIATSKGASLSAAAANSCAIYTNGSTWQGYVYNGTTIAAAFVQMHFRYKSTGGFI